VDPKREVVALGGEIDVPIGELDDETNLGTRCAEPDQELDERKPQARLHGNVGGANPVHVADSSC